VAIAGVGTAPLVGKLGCQLAACEDSPWSHPKRTAPLSSVVISTTRDPRPGPVAIERGASHRTTTDRPGVVVSDPAWWFVPRGRRHWLLTVVMNLENTMSKQIFSFRSYCALIYFTLYPGGGIIPPPPRHDGWQRTGHCLRQQRGAVGEREQKRER
jgi:hypothetical protein